MTVLKPRASCIKFPGGRPRGVQMPRPWDRDPDQMPRGCPGGGGGWAQVELTDALAFDSTTTCANICTIVSTYE